MTAGPCPRRAFVAVAATLALIAAGCADRAEQPPSARPPSPRPDRWVEAWRWEPPEPAYVGAPASDGEHVAFSHETGVALLERGGETLWDVPVDGVDNTAPLLTPELVVVNATPALVALRRSDGSEAWRVEFPAGVTASEPVAGPGVVIVSTNDLDLVAVDAASGQVRWQAETPGIPRGPAALAGDVVVQGWDAGWGGFAVADGRVVWQAPIPDGDTSPVATGRVEDRVVAAVVCTDGRARAVDGATGEPRWEVPVGGSGSPRVAPVFRSDGSVVLPDLLGGLTVVDGATGAQRWAVPGEWLAVVNGPAWLADASVAMPLDDGLVYVAGPAGIEQQIEVPGMPAGVAPLGDGFVTTNRLADETYAAMYRPRRR